MGGTTYPFSTKSTRATPATTRPRRAASGERWMHNDGEDASRSELVADVVAGDRVEGDGLASLDDNQVEPTRAGIGDQLSQARTIERGGRAEVRVGGDVPPAMPPHERCYGGDLGVETCLGTSSLVFSGVDGDSMHHASLVTKVTRDKRPRSVGECK